MRITFLAETTDVLGIVELIVREEVLRVLIRVDLDLGERVVDRGDLVAFSDSAFKPVFEHSQLIALLEFLDERLVALRDELTTDLLEDDLDLSLLAFLVDESAEHDGSSLRVHLEEVDLDVVQEVVLIEVRRELFNELVDVTEEDEGLRVRETKSLEEILDLNRVVACRFFLDDLFDDSELVAFRRCFNVLEVNVLVFRRADDLPEEHEDSVEGSD